MQEKAHMRVCLLNDSFPPTIDGVSNTIFNYAKIIEEKYGDAIVATPRYPDVSDHYPFEVVRLPSVDISWLIGYRAGYPFSREAVKTLAKFKPDLIHSHCPACSMYLARELREVTGAPIIFTYHTKFDLELQRAIKLKLIRKAVIRELIRNVEACDEVWAVNRGAGENLKELGFRGEYLVMPNGVDLSRAPVCAQALGALDAQYGLSADIPLFLFVGRIMWYKGLRFILDSLRALKGEGKRFHMVFVGDGLNRGEVEACVREYGLEQECLFTGTIIDRAQLKLWYSRADLFLLPSVYDNNPLVVKEAAACATASVLVDGSSAAEGVTHGVNGILIENNARSLTEALRGVLAHPEQMKELGEHAARDLYVSWDESVANAFERYCDFLNERAETGGQAPRHNASIRLVSGIYRLQNRLFPGKSDETKRSRPLGARRKKGK